MTHHSCELKVNSQTTPGSLRFNLSRGFSLYKYERLMSKREIIGVSWENMTKYRVMGWVASSFHSQVRYLVARLLRFFVSHWPVTFCELEKLSEISVITSNIKLHKTSKRQNTHVPSCLLVFFFQIGGIAPDVMSLWTEDNSIRSFLNSCN